MLISIKENDIHLMNSGFAYGALILSAADAVWQRIDAGFEEVKP